MRISVTLDDDVVARLTAEARKSGESFNEVINRGLRAGLNLEPASSTQAPFRITPRDLGLKRGLSLDCIAQLLDQIEGPAHR